MNSLAQLMASGRIHEAVFVAQLAAELATKCEAVSARLAELALLRRCLDQEINAALGVLNDVNHPTVQEETVVMAAVVVEQESKVDALHELNEESNDDGFQTASEDDEAPHTPKPKRKPRKIPPPECRCMARIWGTGSGRDQCKYAKKEGDLCSKHAKKAAICSQPCTHINGKSIGLWMGRIDQFQVGEPGVPPYKDVEGKPVISWTGDPEMKKKHTAANKRWKARKSARDAHQPQSPSFIPAPSV